jgi:hypothetical protein
VAAETTPSDKPWEKKVFFDAQIKQASYHQKTKVGEPNQKKMKPCSSPISFPQNRNEQYRNR